MGAVVQTSALCRRGRSTWATVQREARVQKVAVNREYDKKPAMTPRTRRRSQEIYQVALSALTLYCEYRKKCYASALKKSPTVNYSPIYFYPALRMKHFCSHEYWY